MLEPILTVSNGVSDTNELFIRSYQMVQLFERREPRQEPTLTMTGLKPRKATPATKPVNEEAEDTYAELKIGKIAQLVLRPILESGSVSDDEIERLQDKVYS